MIIFGTNAKLTHSTPMPQSVCPHCGENALEQQTLYRYFHLFWIPTFPYRKVRAAECTHCKGTYVGKEVPEAVSNAFLPTPTRPPLSLFVGLVLLFVGVWFLESSAAENRAKYAAYIAAPKANDILVVEQPKDSADYKAGLRYGVMRVSSVQDGNILLQPGNFIYEYWTDVTKALRKGAGEATDYYAVEQVESSLQKLSALHQAGQIKAVIRKES